MSFDNDKFLYDLYDPTPMSSDDLCPPGKFLCGRCYDAVDEVFPANCWDKPEDVSGPIGQFHCEDCGAMVMAGYVHPPLCKRCLDRTHPAFDSGPANTNPA